MGEVYRHSTCNIAATAAFDGRDGCFSTRDPLMARPCIVKGRVGPNRGTQAIVTQYMWEDSITNAPLNRRAWVLQERMLSPRILHFAKNQVFWTCAELVSFLLFVELSAVADLCFISVR